MAEPPPRESKQHDALVTSPGALVPKPKQYAPITSLRALAARSTADVIVVTQDATAVAAMSWKQRYEQVLGANLRLKEHLGSMERAHRKAMTTVKYEPALPNNEVYTKQLMEENRQLLVKNREMELRLFRFILVACINQLDSRPFSATSTPTSTKTSKTITSKARSKARSTAATVKDRSTQTEAVAETPSTVKGVPPSQQALDLLGDLKARLKELELDLDRLRQENDLLRQEKAQQAQELHADENSENQPTNCENQKLASREAKEHDELQSCLRDQMRHMGLLEARYHQLEERARAKADLYKQTVGQIEELNEQLFDAQQQLVHQKQTIQMHEDHNFEVEALRKEAHLLRSENMKLNDAVTTLSSRPFDELSVDLQKKNLWIGQLEEVNKALEAQLEQAKRDFRVVQHTNSQLRERVKRLQQETQDQAQALEQCKLEGEHNKMAREIAELQLRFYTAPGDKRLMCALAKALRDMRAQDDAGSKLTNFMDEVGGKSDDCLQTELCGRCHTTSDQPGSNAEVNSLQKQRLAKISELTKLMKEDTQAQLSSVKLIHTQQMQTLKRKLSKWERRAAEYLDQIRELQREKSELMRRPEHPSRLLLDADHLMKNIPSLGLQGSNESSGASEQHENGRDPMNLIEIILSELRLTNLSTSEGHSGSLVVLCDYYDFESQLSPVIPVPVSSAGNDASIVPLDFGITYKTCQDAVFFRSPVARQLRIELHQLQVGSTKLIAVAELGLNALFLSPSSQCTMTLKLLSPFTHAGIGSIKIEQSLAHPVDAFYKSILRSSKKSALMPSVFPTTSKTRKGVIAIRVISLLLMKTFVSDVKPAASSAPAAHKTSVNPIQLELSYRFVGFPCVKIPVTLPVAASKGGFFVATESFRSFEVDTSADFLHFLERYALELQLRPKQAASTRLGDEQEDIVNGHASVPFKNALRNQMVDQPPSSQSLMLFVSILDSKSKDRLLGRISLEVSLCGFTECAPIPFLPITPKHVIQSIKTLFASASPQTGELQVDWRKFRDVMSFSHLEKSLRQLLYQKKPPTKSNLSNLVTKLNAAMMNTGGGGANPSCSPFASLESFGALHESGGIRLSAIDLAMLLSGLHHACSSVVISPRVKLSTTKNIRSRNQTSMLRRKFALLCETCDDQWLQVEESLQQRAGALGSLNVDFPSGEYADEKSSNSLQSVMIPWETFTQRLGLLEEQRMSDSTVE